MFAHADGVITSTENTHVYKEPYYSISRRRRKVAEKLIDLKLNDYLDVLKSDAPAPGGGSVSALAGAQGAGLLLMVIGLTQGREKYKDFQDACDAAKPVLEEAFDELSKGIDRDTDGFNKVMAALKMPKETEEQKAERRAAIQEGTIASTDAPLRNMRFAVQALEAAEVLSGKFNPNCLSDFGVAVLNLKLCVQGAGMNVKINVPGINDEQVARAYQDKADELEARGSEIADRLYNKTMEEF